MVRWKWISTMSSMVVTQRINPSSMKKLFTIICITLAVITNAQNTFTAKVLDSKNAEALIGASLILKGTTNGVSTDVNGLATLKDIPNGEQIISISFIGYEEEYLRLKFPIESAKMHSILLNPSDTEIGEIIIEATRGNRTVANLPTRTEVLTDEIDEAASMEPSKISHLITHSTGIQVQTTAAGSNGAVVR
ncbi:MAG: carboxypeptidase-like regulatory domain-containing protein, partial [Flavobacteriales bacterium]